MFVHTSGANSPHCFMFSRTISRPMWRDIDTVPFISAYETGEWVLMFDAALMKDNIPEYLRRAVVVPPIYHLYQHVQQYVFDCIQVACGVSEMQLFDALNIGHHATHFHGRAFDSGEGRKCISWGEVNLTSTGIHGVAAAVVAENLYLMQLLNELQQVLYCKWRVCKLAKFRLHVVSRLLAEAVHRCNESHLRHVYWANLYLALPVFLDRYVTHCVSTGRMIIYVRLLTRYNVPLYLIIEEKFEQRFHSNKKHFAAKGGQYDLQALHHGQDRQAGGGGRPGRRRIDQFHFRYQPFRDIHVRAHLVNKSWLAGRTDGTGSSMTAEYGEWIRIEDGVVKFLTSGDNMSVTLVGGDNGLAGVADVIRVNK